MWPVVQAVKRSVSYSHRILVYSGLKDLFMLREWVISGCSTNQESEKVEYLPYVRPVGENVLVEVAPGYFGDPIRYSWITTV